MDSVVTSFYYSLFTMSTLGYGDITPISSWAIILVTIQTLLGVFMELMILARFVSLLPKPDTLDDFE